MKIFRKRSPTIVMELSVEEARVIKESLNVSNFDLTERGFSGREIDLTQVIWDAMKTIELEED